MTIQDAIQAAIGRNRKTQPDIQQKGPEMLGHYNRAMGALFSVAARINPGFYGEITTLTATGGAWQAPANAERVHRLETSAGARVHVVDVNDPEPDPNVPCVTDWGRAYRPANSASSGLGAITCYFSRTPVPAGSLGSNVDGGFPPQFYDLLVLELAVYLALKDERYSENNALVRERDDTFQLYVAHLEHHSPSRTRRTGRGTWDGPSIVSLQALLAGGPR